MFRYYRFFLIKVFLLVEPSIAQSHVMKVVSFNILAPPWAASSHYPHVCADHLSSEVRRPLILDILKSFQESADIICLQEVTQHEYHQIAKFLDGFIGFHGFHASGYWWQHITQDPPWEPNGNAVFVRESVFEEIRFSDVPLSMSGNHSVYFEGRHIESDKVIRLFCVHLDSDKGENRRGEIGAVIDHLGSSRAGVDIIAGDFNSIPFLGDYAEGLILEGYNDLHEAFGDSVVTYPFFNEPTHEEHLGKLDHILVRNGRPLSAGVMDFGLFEEYPVVQGHLHDDGRVKAGLQLTGSDHFPVWGHFEF